MINGFPIITLCGSTKFKEQFIESAKMLTLKGYIVISVGCYGHTDDDEKIQEMKDSGILDKMHRAKINLSDEIFVINVDGYIGKSTLDEIHYAESLHIKITYLE